MAIVQTINSVSQFRDAFQRANRTNFSYEGLKVLFDYLNESCHTYELDVIGLCCEYEEMSIEDLIADYSIDVSDAEGDEDEIKEIVREFLNNRSSVCGETSEGFVFWKF